MREHEAGFGLIGATAMISAGNKIIRENNVEDPADYISSRLIADASQKYNVTPIDSPGILVADEAPEKLAKQYAAANYLLDLRTVNWGFSDFPTDWNSYAVTVGSKLRVKPRLLLVVLAAAFMASLVPIASASDVETEKQAILALISRMEAAWNRGDFRGYMEGFANPDVIFVSRGEFQKDWQGTLDHYIRDYGASEATRGRLHFYDIRIEILAPDAAQLNSRFRLDRPENPLDGISTRLMRKRDGKWVITHNHVSAREIPCSD